ncbi:hypothetical protein E2320_018990 [Naja naja]|nr:hypothetical protein E2320_018990 [Naja naja]
MRRRESSVGGMDVGAAQFPEMLPRLEELVLGCDFVGLDMEFTGLHSDSQHSLFDLPAEWYRKGRQCVQQFTVNQLGELFWFLKYRYIAHSYNFFLFPATFGQMDSEFSCQTSSIQFLSHYDFDYNKFLKDGIPYMNETQEKKLQHLLSGNWMVQSFDKDKVKKVIDQVTCWISSAEEEDSMVLHDIYGFQVIELQLILRKAFPDIWTIPLKDEKLMVKKMNPQYRWDLENTAFDPCQREQILYSARGFTNIFQTLPLVGHNMLMDLLYLHEKFYKPLPENYEEFKDNIHFLFPVLLDTKNITKATWKEFQFPQVSYLLELYETLCSIVKPTDQLCPEIFHSDDSLRYGTHQTAAPTFSQYIDVLTAYVNQVNLIRGAIQKINFSGADDLTTRPPLLLATVRGWRGATEEQIHQELRSFCRFDVRRLRKNHIRIVMKVYKTHPNLKISVYHHWKHSPRVTSFLQICGIVASWSLLAFLLGGSYSCRV